MIFEIIMWAFAQTFITSGIIWFKAYQNKSEYVSNRIVVETEIIDPLNFILYLALFLFSIYIIFLLFSILTIETIVIMIMALFYTGCIVFMPVKYFSKIKESYRIPHVTYKNKYFMIFSPYFTLLIVIFFVIILIVKSSL